MCSPLKPSRHGLCLVDVHLDLAGATFQVAVIHRWQRIHTVQQLLALTSFCVTDALSLGSLFVLFPFCGCPAEVSGYSPTMSSKADSFLSVLHFLSQFCL